MSRQPWNWIAETIHLRKAISIRQKNPSRVLAWGCFNDWRL